MQLPFIISGNGDLNIIFLGRPYQVKKEDDSRDYDKILKVISGEEECTDEEFEVLLNPIVRIQQHVDRQISSKLKIEHGQVTYMGYEVHGVAVDRLFEFASKGLPTKPLENFLVNVCENPSRTSAERLYAFLQHKNLPLTPDGCFLGYKAVEWDYKSKSAGPQGKLDNKIGTVVEVPRGCVDDNASNACSHGLHVGTLKYAEGFGCFTRENPDRILIVKVNPRDVVTVPHGETDKLRCCRYEVLSEYCKPLTEPVQRDDQLPSDDEVDEFEDENDDEFDEEYDDEYDEEEDDLYEDDDEEEDDEEEEPTPTKWPFT